LWKADRFAGGLSPRFGMPLNLAKNTVLRGGFALFTNMIPTAGSGIGEFPGRLAQLFA
jgi:hypothetical protein